MSRRFRGAAAVVAVTTGAFGWVGCQQLFGIEDGIEVPAPVDGSSDGQPVPPSDGGSDVTRVTPSDGAADGTLASEGGGDASGASDANDVSDTGGDACTVIVARMLRAPIVPPSQWAGLDLTNGGASDDVPGSGGLTLVLGGVRSCATAVEPTMFPSDSGPAEPGYRAAWYGAANEAGAYPLAFSTNLQSGSIYQVSLTNGYTGTLSFHSRAGGKYGSHAYEVAIGAVGCQTNEVDASCGVDAGAGRVTRDGVDFPADWSLPTDDAGVQVASAWINEMYDGIMATYSPGTPAIDDCYSTPITLYNYLDGLYFHESASCLVYPANGSAYLGMRSLALYLMFNVGTNQVNEIYNFWLGSITSCSTQTANLERMNYWPIYASQIGGLTTSEYVSNPSGITFTEANSVECNGISVAPEDDGGYSAMAWGPSGEVVMEYDGAGLNYKVSAKAGYKGLFTFSDATLTNNYSTGIGVPMTNNQVPYPIEWPADAGTSTPSLTQLSNDFCYLTDTDCVAAGDCDIRPNDGHGHAVFDISCAGSPGFPPFIGLVYPIGQSAPTEIYTVNYKEALGL